MEIGEAAGAEAVAVAFHDYQHSTAWGYQAERWFHAASTIKVPVLFGVFDAVQRGDLSPDSRVQVRNRFQSVADGHPYRVEAGRDADRDVHRAIGHTLTVRELARHMITTSSNLATNLLVDLVGLPAIRGTIERLGLEGIDLVRGVEDMAAWEAGINNRVTAAGLAGALRALHEEHHFPEELRAEMVGILHAQEFRGGIPAGLPEEARVANKTGEISTVAHDAGIVFLDGREPYVVAILTEWAPETGSRREAIAAISRAVFRHVTEGELPEGDERAS
jgi:beta-lactamase class A